MNMFISFNEKLPRPTLTAEGFAPVFAENMDFWRIHLDNGENRELTVFSTEQEPPVVRQNGDDTVYTYASLKAEDGAVYDVTYELTIRRGNGGLTFLSKVENRDAVRVNEIQAPFFAFDRLNSQPEEEELYIPNSLGERIPNPRKWVADTCHTEYMAADYQNIWYTATYPEPMTMTWMGVQSGNRFFYLNRKDDRFRICCFCVGTSPRNTRSQLVLTISQYPMAVQGETIETAPVFAGVCDGWRTAARDYRAWADTWFHPAPKPEWVQNMTGWQRIIMKHQYGEIFFKYEDLPQLYKDGAEVGLDTLLVFGWWKGRFDNGYPEYEPDEALGGAEALRRAIAEVQDMGGHVLLYTNGRLIDTKSDFYREYGHDCCQMDIDGNEYKDHYQFSNNGTVLRKFGYKSFVTGCMASPQWRARMMENTRIKKQFHPHSLFYDQIGGCRARLCFNSHHDHGNRPDEEVLYRLKALDAVRAEADPGQAIGSEHLVDVFAQKFDYLHGDCGGCWLTKYTYPYLFLSTFPEVIQTNRIMHDERADMHQHYNNAFILGLRFDASVYRCRKVSIKAMPEMSRHVRHLLQLKDRYRRYFYEGKLISERDYELPAGVRCAEHLSGEDHMIAFLNNNPDPITFDFLGHCVTIEGEDVACLEL